MRAYHALGWISAHIPERPKCDRSLFHSFLSVHAVTLLVLCFFLPHCICVSQFDLGLCLRSRIAIREIDLIAGRTREEGGEGCPKKSNEVGGKQNDAANRRRNCVTWSGVLDGLLIRCRPSSRHRLSGPLRIRRRTMAFLGWVFYSSILLLIPKWVARIHFRSLAQLFWHGCKCVTLTSFYRVATKHH